MPLPVIQMKYPFALENIDTTVDHNNQVEETFEHVYCIIQKPKFVVHNAGYQHNNSKTLFSYSYTHYSHFDKFSKYKAFLTGIRISLILTLIVRGSWMLLNHQESL